MGRPIPTDGEVGFSYTRDPAVTGCSQETEADVQDLITGVVHTDPFVRSGKAPVYLLKTSVKQASPGVLEARLTLVDDKGADLGTTTMRDPSCDGLHLKLASSIALLLQPRGDASCDTQCRAEIEAMGAERGRAEVRAKEVPWARQEGAAAAEKRVRRSYRAVVGAGAALGLNASAEPSWGIWLAAESRWESWSFGLESRVMLPSAAYPLAADSALDQMTASVLIVPCIRYRWVGACLLAEAGAVTLSGSDVSAARLSSALLGLGARSRVDIPLAAGFEARVTLDLIGYPLVLDGRFTSTAGAGTFTLDAPRRVGAFLSIGVARSFD